MDTRSVKLSLDGKDEGISQVLCSSRWMMKAVFEECAEVRMNVYVHDKQSAPCKQTR